MSVGHLARSLTNVRLVVDSVFASLVAVLSVNPGIPRAWTATELRRSPPSQQDEILRQAAELAEADYRNDRELTTFEAFGPHDFYPDTPNAELRRS
jgi:hypothetical protein